MVTSTNQTIAERVDCRVGVPPFNGTSATGAWHDIAGYNRFAANLVASSVSSGNSATVTLRSAEDDSGTGAADYASVTETNGAATPENLSAFVEGHASHLPSGHRYVQVTVSTDDSALDMAATFVTADGSYRP